MGHMAEAIMTKSFINPRAKKYFKEKEEVCAFLVICFLENYSIVRVWPIKMLKYDSLEKGRHLKYTIFFRQGSVQTSVNANKILPK